MFLIKTKRVVLTFVFLSLFLILELLYLSFYHNKKNVLAKVSFVQATALPDLAFNSSNSFLRHRSLSNIAQIYPSEPALLESALQTYTFCNGVIKER